MTNAVNTAQNAGTALPPPNSLSSPGVIDGSSALAGTGTLRIAVLDDDGIIQSYSDLNLASYATVDDLVSALDGLNGVTASISADGKLTISADDSSLGLD